MRTQVCSTYHLQSLATGPTIANRNPEDTKVLINDWPYGNAPGILHLVCWTKSPISTLPGLGDLTPEARAIIDKWVHDTFVVALGKENVLWFKNWASIQSVRSVEHIHVLIRGYTDEFLASVVGKDAADGTIRLVGELEKEEKPSGMECDEKEEKPSEMACEEN